jgi:pyroglutamyl-peptidase
MTLVTAFEPFDGATVNGSLEAARLWAGRDPSLALVELPVTAGLAEERAFRALEETRPELYLALGEAPPRPWEVRLEGLYVNLDDFRIPDNGGNQHRGTPICAGGAAVHYSTVDVRAIAEELQGKVPTPVRTSGDAGRFLCNRLGYAVANWGSATRFCFVHLPAWRPDDGAESLNSLVETLAKVKEIALRPPSAECYT